MVAGLEVAALCGAVLSCCHLPPAAYPSYHPEPFCQLLPAECPSYQSGHNLFHFSSIFSVTLECCAGRLRVDRRDAMVEYDASYVKTDRLKVLESYLYMFCLESVIDTGCTYRGVRGTDRPCNHVVRRPAKGVVRSYRAA